MHSGTNLSPLLVFIFTFHISKIIITICQIAIGGVKGVLGMRAPLPFFSISFSFRDKIGQNKMFVHPSLGLGPPLAENPGSATDREKPDWNTIQTIHVKDS